MPVYSCLILRLRYQNGSKPHVTLDFFRAVQSPDSLIESVVAILLAAHNTDPKLLAHLRIPLFSSLSLLLQHMRTERIVGKNYYNTA